MRVGVISYPSTNLRVGGLQVQMSETINALNTLGIEARFFDFQKDELCNFDLIHIFSARHGNHLIVQEASNYGVPVVLSPVHQINVGLIDSAIYKLSASLIYKLCKFNHLAPEYQSVQRALKQSSAVIALSDVERKALAKLYGKAIDEKTHVVRNGISTTLLSHYKAHKECTPNKDLKEQTILYVGSISKYKNQRLAIKVAKDLGCNIKLAGPVLDNSYLNTCLADYDKCRYIGLLPANSPELASAYQQADTTMLVSKGEVFPLTIIESLALGTPAIVTNKTALDIPPSAGMLEVVNPRNYQKLKEATSRVLNAKVSPDKIYKIVNNYRWVQQAKNLVKVYRRVAKTR